MKLNMPKKYIILYSVMSALGVLAFILFGHYLSLLLSDIVIEGEAPAARGLVWVAVFFFLYALLSFIYRIVGAGVANERIENLTHRVVAKIDDHTRKHSESMLNAIFVHLEKYRPFEKVFIPTVIQTTVKITVIIAAMFFIHRNAAFIMIFTAPFVPLYYILVGLRTKDESEAQATQFDELGTLFLNLIRGKNTVQYTGSERTVIARLKHYNEQYVKDTMHILKYAFQSTLMLEFITILGIGLIALEVGLQIIIFENITFYAAFFTLLLAPEFYNALKVLGIEFHNGKLSQGNLERIEEWLESESNGTDYRNFNASQAVSLENVSIGYDDDMLLENVDLSLPDTGFTAITGPSGIGKSTFVRMLLGLHRPKNGTVALSDGDIGYISDEVYFSDTTIYEYVSGGEYAEADVVAILEKLGLMDSLGNLDKGIHAPIVNHNIPLSGGEIVRLKMARVLIRRPKIILMDEPTEFLDATTEEMIMAYLAELKQDSAIIAVVHRRKLLKIADHHYTFSNGQIVLQKGGA
ncbi:ATP-binding cassette domain-containing protein [Salinicoccus sp. ID82-1]|uniref:ATP-binding cassette domain-containing protein n=1 Tax=Salinicoccus sp. ID82-1 TaxID=2820269 RepID=UPI001F025BA5|nr:ATP-binding cassette domain-containing protein [Salinicoccus sp. ID82-1]MCG1010213.1 ATP-binding cassette domain-containing protein [Salinicoccus sp. ID82-1]